LTLDRVDPASDLLDVTDAEQLRVLGHPARMRLLLSLGADGATVSQLSARLGTNKGNVAHHLAVLERAGLVRRGRTRTVRGGTEQYFERVARRVRTPGGAASGHTTAMLQAVAEEVYAAPGDPLLHLRRLRMTPQRAAALAAHLDRLVADLPEGRASDPEVSVLVGLYRSSGAG
jgi:DNA-binding transcriptional ArsR family regulator